ncbi:MAG: pilus assembly protein PilM [Planctomycetes bacterium]|nr:pilus assembly protein PilM [Planctomycetota bacterium]
MTTFLRKLGDLVRRGQQRRFSAIDFDSRHVRIVQGEQTAGGARIVKLATADVPEGLDMADPQALGALLGRTLDQMRLRNAPIIMSVPRGQAVLKPVILPPVATTSELAGMVQYQAEKELSFRPDEAVVDFTLESHYGIEHATGGQEAEGEHVLVAAVRRPVVEYYQAVAKAAGARLLRLGLRPYANMRCVQAYVPHEGAGRVALVHVTADEAEIDVMDAGALAFSRSAVVKVPASGGPADPAVRDAIATVVTEVTRSLQSYLGVERDHRIDVLLVAGGTGIEPQVREELFRRLSVRCELLNPARALGLEDPGPAASAFVSALGLALAQGPEAVSPFDFLNPKRPVVQRDLKKAAAIAAVAALVLALLGVVGSAALYRYAAESRVSGLTEEYNKLKEENRKIGALAKRLETVDSWVRAGRNWLDQWAYLSAVFPSCTDVYATNLKTSPDGSVNFTVKAKSNEAINELGKRLAAAGYDFKPGQVTSGSDPYGYTYATTIKVMVKPGMKVDLASVSPVPRPEDDASAKEFGKTSAAASGATASGATSAGAAGPAAGQPGPDAPYPVRYKAWMGRYEALMKERPPDSQVEAATAWRAKREALRAEMPKMTPSRPPPSSGSGKHNHE